eukprot:TRINITY_DN6341_c0_g1_i2.p1 TRINITY_DN6341_c0_g1~~TRINITY_DN6341_c0_g1_i2.p1  ORF type:complete len:270 (-),score=78.41 TRINITY_DN6341_c0_g1_i2:26-835(-)
MDEYSARLRQIKTIEQQKSSLTSSGSSVVAPPAIDWASLQKAERDKQQGIEQLGKLTAMQSMEEASKALTIATREDSAANYEEACKQYMIAVDHTLRALEEEQNPSIKAAMREKTEQYLQRIQQLRQFLSKSEATPSSPASLKDSKQKSASKIEVSPAASTLLEQAIECATKGSASEETGNNGEAVNFYVNAVSLFSQALKVEGNPTVRSMISEKMVWYNSRAEQLRQLEASGSIVPNPIKLGGEKGEKYKAPPTAKRSKKEKKTWKKF